MNSYPTSPSSKILAGFVFILSLPCGIIASCLLWITLLEPGIYINPPLFGKNPSTSEELFVRGGLLFMSMLFFVPQVGTLRRILNYDSFLPRSMALLMGGIMVGASLIGLGVVVITGSWHAIEGVFGLFFLGQLFLKMSKR